jgi:chromosome segregation ATPase
MGTPTKKLKKKALQEQKIEAFRNRFRSLANKISNLIAIHDEIEFFTKNHAEPEDIVLADQIGKTLLKSSGVQFYTDKEVEKQLKKIEETADQKLKEVTDQAKKNHAELQKEITRLTKLNEKAEGKVKELTAEVEKLKK